MKNNDDFDPTTERVIHGLGKDFAGKPILGDSMTYRSCEQALKDFTFYDFMGREILVPSGVKAIRKTDRKEYQIKHLTAIPDREIATVDDLPYIFIIDFADIVK